MQYIIFVFEILLIDLRESLSAGDNYIHHVDYVKFESKYSYEVSGTKLSWTGRQLSPSDNYSKFVNMSKSKILSSSSELYQ